MSGQTPKKKKKPENYDQRLKILIEKALAHKSTAAYSEKLKKSFAPFRKKVSNVEEFWTWIESLQHADPMKLSAEEERFVSDLLQLIRLTDTVFEGQFYDDFFILLGGYILFEAVPKDQRLLSIGLRLTKPSDHGYYWGTAVITILPNARQSDVIALIKRKWKEISSINQYADLDDAGRLAWGSPAALLDRQRASPKRERDRRIAELHRRRLPTPSIQQQLAEEGFGLVKQEIIRKAISDTKKKGM